MLDQHVISGKASTPVHSTSSVRSPREEMRSIREYLENIVRTSGLQGEAYDRLLNIVNSNLSGDSTNLNLTQLVGQVSAEIKRSVNHEKGAEEKKSIERLVITDEAIEYQSIKLSAEAQRRVHIRSQKIDLTNFREYANTFMDETMPPELRDKQYQLIKQTMEGPNKVVQSSIQIINETPPVIVKSIRERQEKDIAYIQQLMKDPVLADRYIDILPEMDALRIPSNDAHAFLQLLGKGQLSTDEALVMWHDIKSKDKAEYAKYARPTIMKHFTTIDPGMAELFASMDHMKDSYPIVTMLNKPENAKLKEETWELISNLSHGSIPWASLTEEQQRNVVAFYSESIEKVTADTLCVAEACLSIRSHEEYKSWTKEQDDRIAWSGLLKPMHEGFATSYAGMPLTERQEVLKRLGTPGSAVHREATQAMKQFLAGELDWEPLDDELKQNIIALMGREIRSVNGNTIVTENGSFTLPPQKVAKEVEAPEAAATPAAVKETGKDFSSLVPKGLTTLCSDARDVPPEELGDKPIPSAGVQQQPQKGLVYG